ncbi:MAG: class I SAM-dependent methyltransferase [archaeon]|jgi:2-polyprenyl-3-methyl-5-hydroxy-6-metoxy-1,4-benzoquinol methylase
MDKTLLGMNAKKKEEKVKELYEKWPYPSREIASKKDLSKYLKWISAIFTTDENFWKEKKVLDAGCGTGELANALALGGASVLGIDFSSAAIKKAKKLAQRTQSGAKFKEKNILNFKIKKKFDVVIALGSLHHTTNAEKGFQICASHLNKEGLIILGLYNKYSRTRLRAKRIVLFALCGSQIEKRIELGKKLFGGPKNNYWAADKYGQVHESYHTINEVLRWFEKNEIDFVSSKPKFEHPVIDELKWLAKKENAFFVMIGRKN